ncbi:hypothetical protein SteCoe_30452 [Stentor coeruleus]|uniref:EGF-like domain-containing protein n=1 Tax=Stentor coeruleus TaxID=5963 RepID=A0A1R2B3P5_9CILI|nr:hypothetical protein SteCoe_30452 [Stentor coeruleus]
MISLLLLTLVSSTKIVDYRFGYNFGQVFHDYSLSGNDAINGNSVSTTTYDTIPTDRGAYYSYTSGQMITLPPNSQQSNGLSLGSKFYICMWVLVQQGNYYLTYRENTGKTQYFYLYRQALDNLSKSFVKFSGYSSGERMGSVNGFLTNVWVFLVLSIDDLSGYVYINDVKEITFTYTSVYSETGTFSHYIGYYNYSPIGFFWNYLIYINESYTTSVFTISTYTPGNCLVNTCPSSCTPGIIWNENSYCISINSLSTTSGSGTSCSICTGGCNSDGTCFDCEYASSCDITTGTLMEINSDGTLNTYSPCNNGEYLDSNGNCQSCMSYCSTCDDNTSCILCLTSNAYINDSGQCTCPAGTFASDLTSISGCQSCDAECLTCSGSSTFCSTCTATEASAGISGKCICKDGTYENDLTISSGCIACDSKCLTCSGSSSFCLTCTATDATADIFGKCICKDGTYENDLTQELGCVACESWCKKCEDSADKCTSCTAIEAYPDDHGICQCSIGTYAYDLTTTNGCSPCLDQCKTCLNANSCTECADPYAEIGDDGLCFCQNGKYALNSNIDYGCYNCYEGCKTCLEPLLCLTCSDPNASPSPISGCDCNLGYYKSLSGSCNPCFESCESCIEGNKCLTCLSENTIPSEIQGCECISGYYDSSYNQLKNCKPCDISCIKCSNEINCLECKENYILDSNNKCVKICNTQQFEYLGICYDCPDLCLTCNKNSCLTCEDNSQIQGINCTCLWGYKGKTVCEKTYFTASIEINKNNDVNIKFTEEINEDLGYEDFNITSLDKCDLSYEFFKNDAICHFSIENCQDMAEGFTIKIEIIKENVRSVSGSFLDKYIFEGEVYGINSEVDISQGLKNIVNSTNIIMKTTLCATIASGLMGSPSCIWIFFNTIDILSFLPLGGVPYTERIDFFLESIGGLKILPNPFSMLFNINNYSEPYKQAKDYGFTTSYIIINGFSLLFNFLLLLGLIPLLYIAHKILPKIISEKCYRIIKDYKFNYFIRFWTQSYLSLGILSFVQIKSKYEWNFEGVFNVCLASILLIVVILSPLILLIISFIAYHNEISDTGFKVKRKYSCHFKEFRNNKGFLSTQFYTFYFLRRLLYIFTQITLIHSLGTQVILNLIFSALQLLYLIVFLPFKDKYAMVSAIISEACILEIMTLSLLFLNDLSTKKLEILETTIILSVFICANLHNIISICAFISKFKDIKSFILEILESIKKKKKITSKIECDNVTHTREIEISTSRTFVGNLELVKLD